MNIYIEKQKSHFEQITALLPNVSLKERIHTVINSYNCHPVIVEGVYLLDLQKERNATSGRK